MQISFFKYVKENWFFILVLFVTGLVYSKLLIYPAISWDDPEMIFKNKAVKEFNLTALLNNHYVGNYIPVTMVLHALTWNFFQNWTGGYHLLSIFFHLMNIMLVYKISLALFKNRTTALIAISIFALHPLQIESVAWISEFKTVLSATFYFLSVLFFINYLQNQKKVHYLMSVILFALASLSKPSVIMLPLVLMFIEIFKVKKIVATSFIKYLPFLFISFLIGYITLQTQKADQFINHSHEFAYITRIAMAGFAYLNYFILFLLPFNLSVIYSFPSIGILNQIIGALVLLSAFFIFYYLYKTKKTKSFLALLFFSLNLLLMVQFIPFGEALNADRYMYIAIIGFGWIIGFVFEKLKLEKTGALIVLLLFCSILTFARLNVWRNSLTLYEDVLNKYPNQFVALNSAGVECMLINDHQKSLTFFQKAIASAPNNYKGYYNLGLLYLKNNQAKLAIDCFNRAINLYEYYKAYTGRASAYYMLKDLPKAMNDANKVLNMDTNNSKAYFILGNCYNDLNNLDEALKAYNQAIKNNGDESDYYFKRAIVFGKQQHFNSCLSDLIVCLELNPNNYEAHYWKGVSLVNLNKSPCEDFKIAAQNNFEPALNAYNKYCR